MTVVSRTLLVMVFVARSLSAGLPYLLKDINPSTRASSDPLLLQTIGNTSYFLADDGSHGLELWKTDSTESGTQLVKDINPGIAPGVKKDRSAYAFRGRLIFSALNVPDMQVWITDGSESGTTMLTDMHPATPLGFNAFLIGATNDAAYFIGSSTPGGGELWRTDGTVAGTRMVVDLHVRSGTFPFGFGTIGNSVVFFATTATRSGLFISDGTAEGTRTLGGGGGVAGHVPFGNGLVFAAFEDANTFGIYRTEGTIESITRLHGGFKVDPNRAFEPFVLASLGNFVYFTGDDGVHGRQLWRTDGTVDGTAIVAVPGPGSVQAGSVATVGDNVFFLARSGSVDQLWKSDGTAAGTKLVKDGLANAYGGFAWHGAFYFACNDGLHGTEPWISDGTTSGTQMLHDINPGMGSSNPFQYFDGGNVLYFSADDGLHGMELWAYSNVTAPVRRRAARP